MQRTLTGRHVLAMFGLGFGIIIAVNLTMAWNAISSFPGLETPNSYVASQQFEATRAAQEALGWQADARLQGGALVLTLTGPDGTPVADAQVAGVLGRATHVADDLVPAFVFDGAAWRAPVDLGPGNWDLRLTATAADGTPFQKRLKLRIAP